MRAIHGLVRLGAVAVGVSLASGCAPVLGAGSGLGYLQPAFSSCALVGGSPVGQGMSRSASITLVIPRLQRMQARYNFGYNDVRAHDQRMRQVASGDC
jgi:hypothetical protein